MNTDILLTIEDLWKILRRAFLAMLITAILATSVLFAWSHVFSVPRYQSTAILYCLRQNDETISTSEDFSLAQKVVSDCGYLLKSHSVLDTVISDLGLNMSYRDLYEAVSTKNPEDTRILEVTAQAENPDLAKQIVDAVCTVGTERIREAMGFQQVNLYEYGTWEGDPCNRVTLQHYGLTFAGAMVLVYAGYVVLFLMKDKRR